MKPNKSLRFVLSGMLLVLGAATLGWWLSRPETPATTVTNFESEAPVVVAPRRPGVRFQPAVRSGSARISNQPTPASQEKLCVEWKGTWYSAEILASSNGSNYIRYSGYGPEWDEWVTAERMRYSSPLEAPPQNTSTPTDVPPAQDVRMTPEPGDSVVLWGNRWWRAEVLQTEGDKSLIRYVGYGAEWDEWVGADRFKVYSEEDARNSAATATLTYSVTAPEAVTIPEAVTAPEPEINRSSLVQGSPAQGDLLVEWGSFWWPAEILKQEGASYLIHYKGYGTNWDEWVTLERVGFYSGAE